MRDSGALAHMAIFIMELRIRKVIWIKKKPPSVVLSIIIRIFGKVILKKNQDVGVLLRV